MPTKNTTREGNDLTVFTITSVTWDDVPDAMFELPEAVRAKLKNSPQLRSPAGRINSLKPYRPLARAAYVAIKKRVARSLAAVPSREGFPHQRAHDRADRPAGSGDSSGSPSLLAHCKRLISQSRACPVGTGSRSLGNSAARPESAACKQITGKGFRFALQNFMPQTPPIEIRHNPSDITACENLTERAQ